MLGYANMLSRDPIAENGVVNLDAYAAKNPSDLVDPKGKHPVAVVAVTVAASAALGASAATVTRMAYDAGRGQMSSVGDYQRSAAAGAAGGIARMWGGPLGSPWEEHLQKDW